MQQRKALVAREDQPSYEHNHYVTEENTGNYAVAKYMDVVDIRDIVMCPQYINPLSTKLYVWFKEPFRTAQ